MRAEVSVLKSFESECEAFNARMDKGRDMLVGGIDAAHAGWKDSGYDNVKKMVAAIAQDIETIKGMVSSQVLPYVQETISILESRPY